MQVKLVHITPETEKHIAYVARVSSSTQSNPEFEKLLAYLIKHKHWSPFEMCSFCVEITTTRAIAPQILRHRSFSFQEFSQRYSKSDNFEAYIARSQDTKNRQNSIDDCTQTTKDWFEWAQKDVWRHSKKAYDEALQNGIAKELARTLLPLNTSTKLYMHGTIRSWIHYIELRTANETQLEHRLIAEECRKIFVENLPTISKALEWI